ncbi:hypothetical protein BDV93DRAFT_305188 [Ceratobasidium sp. AG-I]|nr:hypothetical protein BDV93DRAFT_305188 [Ceratobasidium sp. AG-I]
MPPAARTSGSPPSNDDDDLEHAGTGIHSRSRNARAQARHRAKRKAYIESLETNVKRLQALVDAHGLDSNAYQPLPPAAPHSHPYAIRDLQDDNARLRREHDAMRVQLAALSAHVSSGGHIGAPALPSMHHFAHPSPPGSDGHTPPPGSERDNKKRKMSAEREHAPLYLSPRPRPVCS